MKEGLSGDMVVDTGVLIDLVAGTAAGRSIGALIKSGTIRPCTTEINVTELRYILCRRAGPERAKQVVRGLLESGYLKVVSASSLAEEASLVKCKRSISLADCFTIALAEKLQTKLLLAKHEKELDAEIKKHPFDTGILFLDDLLK